MLPAGDQGQGIVLFPGTDAQSTADIIDHRRECHEEDTIIQLIDLMGMDEVIDAYVNDDETGNRYERSLNGRRNEFHFTMTIWMILVARLRRYIKAVYSDQSGHHIDDAFQGVGEDRHRGGQVPGQDLDGEQYDRDQSDPFLYTEIMTCGLQIGSVDNPPG